MTSEILLTGLPRSGTTWTSQAVASAVSGRLVHEPFNWKRNPDRVEYHMRYLTAYSTDIRLYQIYEKALNPRIRDLLRTNRRIVVKDVHICLALEYLWQHFKPLIIIMMRHPGDVASSWRSLNLEARSRIKLLLAQESLVSTYLAPFESHLRSNEDYFFEIGAYWGASYYVMDRISEEHSEWVWVSHEWLCKESLQHYLLMLFDLGLNKQEVFPNRLGSFLDKHDWDKGDHRKPYSVSRRTSQEPGKWRDLLSPLEVQAVFDGAAPFGMLEKLSELSGSTNEDFNN